jgi:hypothetical protein
VTAHGQVTPSDGVPFFFLESATSLQGLVVCRLSYPPSELVILTVPGELLESPEQPLSAQRRAERCGAVAFCGRQRRRLVVNSRRLVCLEA